MKFAALAMIAVTLVAATDDSCPTRTKAYNKAFNEKYPSRDIILAMVKRKTPILARF